MPNRAKYRQLTAAGLCPSCKKPAQGGYVHCAPCRAYKRAYGKAHQKPRRVIRDGYLNIRRDVYKYPETMIDAVAYERILADHGAHGFYDAAANPYGTTSAGTRLGGDAVTKPRPKHVSTLPPPSTAPSPSEPPLSGFRLAVTVILASVAFGLIATGLIYFLVAE